MKLSTLVCGKYRTLCINNDGNVLSFGYSNCGAHGYDEEEVFPPKMISSLHHIISIDVGGYRSVCLANDGNVFTFGRNDYGQLGISAYSGSVYFTHSTKSTSSYL